MYYILPFLTVSYLLNLPGRVDTACTKLRDLLNDDSIRISGPNNDICILSGASCCNKAVENKLLDKTKDVLKNRAFLVLNEFYRVVDTDKTDKRTLLTKIITTSTLPIDKRVAMNEKFSSYISGVNTLTSDDLEEMKTASAVGSIQASLGAELSETCQDLLFFEMENLKDAELKYLGSILVMLRGYDIMVQLITKAQAVDLSEECYIGAVRGGLKDGVSKSATLKFGGCNLCSDSTDFSQPCSKLCRNILSGCLKGHIQTREYLMYLTEQQMTLNTLIKKFSTDRDTLTEDLKLAVKSKLQVDKSFYNSCSSLQQKRSQPSQGAIYSFDLNYDIEAARKTLDSDWLCQYVFSGVSEVNCWNRSSVGPYRLNIYEFTSEGQHQNPEVPGKGPNINIDDQIDEFKEYKLKVEELSQGRGVLTPSSAPSSVTTHLLTLTLALYNILT